jgi:hypothetical protein
MILYLTEPPWRGVRMSYFDRTRGKTATRLLGIGFATLAAGATALALSVVGCGGSSGGGSSSVSGAAIWTTNQVIPGGHAGVIEFTQNQLRHLAIANVPPKKQNLSASFFSPQDDFFDFFNDLFVIDGGNGVDADEAVYEFTPKQLMQLKKNDAPAPAFTISTLGGDVPFIFPQFGALDASGNLWVSDTGRQPDQDPDGDDGIGVIFKFTAQQLTASTGVGLTPAAVLEGPNLLGPLGMAFDGSGNMWVANNGDTTLVKISSSTLSSASGVVFPVPVAATFESTIPAAPGQLPSINGPWGLAFDDFGNLWVSNEQNIIIGAASDSQRKELPAVAAPETPGSVVQFAAAIVSAATGTSTPTPAVVLTPASVDSESSIDDPQGLSIDLADNFLFIANAAGNSISAFDLDGIASGNPVPNLFIFGGNTTLNAPAGLTIGKAF